MRHLTEVERERYGGDRRAINRHSTRGYRDSASGELFLLSRTTDARPRVFEAYGPYTEATRGALPSISVGGQHYWGAGWSWPAAVAAFLKAIDGGLVEPLTGGVTE